MRSARALAPTAVLALGAVLVGAVAGCASTGGNTGQPQRVSPSARSGAAASAAFTRRAGTLASAFDGSPVQLTWQDGYVPQDDGVRLPPGAFHSGADQAAYRSGRFRYAVTPPTGPAQQTVRFDTGTTRTLPGLSAQQALRVESASRCPKGGCPATELTVTSVRATTERERTSQGMANVPAWAATVAGYQGAFVFPAVRPEQLPQQPIANLQGSGYQGARLVQVSADGRTLTLQAVATCGHAQPTGLTYETKDVVVVGATDLSEGTQPITSCAEAARLVHVQVHLGDTLGGRSVLNVLDGVPEFPQA